MPPTTSGSSSRCQPFDEWVDRCQIAVGCRRGSDRLGGHTLLDLVTALPGDLTPRQQDRAGRLLARLFCRFVSTLDRRFVSELARRALVEPDPGDWFAASHRLAAVVVRAASVHAVDPSALLARQVDERVETTLSEIDRRFADPRYGLRVAAERVALSSCRLTQLLKAATGRTFGLHLHHRRIAEARALLHESGLSIKEIANRVGYQSTTQLDRHFKRIAHRVPTAYRAGPQPATHGRQSADANGCPAHTSAHETTDV